MEKKGCEVEIILRTEGAVTIVAISGNLDGSTAAGAQEKIIPLLTEGCRLVFDMEQCEYISSAGLRLLLVIAKHLEKVGGAGTFASLTQQTVDVMAMTGFDNIFTSYASVAEAVNSIAKV